MNTPNFAVIKSQGIEVPAAVAAANFMDGCQKSPAVMAAALAIANEAPNGNLDASFVGGELGRVTPDVASALGRIADLFATGGDKAIDFYPVTKTQQVNRGIGRQLAADIAATTDTVEREKLANRLRLLPYRRYVRQLLGDAQPVNLSEAA